MRTVTTVTLLVLLAAAACHGSDPAAPDPAAYAAMDASHRCEATAPRTRACTAQLMAASVRSLAAGSDLDLSSVMGSEAPATDEADALHQAACTGDPGYADAVLACWTRPDCESFAQCVYGKRPPRH